MESPNYDLYQQAVPAKPQRPDFLKILCIFSFIACGLWILGGTFGALGTLSIDQETLDKVWPQITENNPQFESMDGMEFMHAFGMWCIYMVIANVFSLVGVIMMWRLERIGFFIYVVAELSTHFFSLDVPGKNDSAVGTVFSVLIDLVFIAMYFVNLKHMNKKNNNTFVQSGN